MGGLPKRLDIFDRLQLLRVIDVQRASHFLDRAFDDNAAFACEGGKVGHDHAGSWVAAFLADGVT